MRTHLTAIGILLLLAGCSVLPRQDAAPELPIPQLDYTEFQLDNGLRLIVHEDRDAPLVAVNVWYHVGSKNEPPGRSGFAHLFEHLMFNGSENHRDEFFRPLEDVGATGMNGTTNGDRTNYFATVPAPALDRLLWLESDRMGHLLGAIDQATLDEQRDVVKNEKRQRENEPYGRVWEWIPRLSYPAGHPYSWSTIGSMDDLDAATLDDVGDWFRRWYGAANATLVIAGDISAREARDKVEHYFGHISPGPRLERPARWEAPMADARRVTMRDDVPQQRIYRVYNVAANYTPELIDLQLAASILGGGKTSRLHERLVWREQSATGVGAFVAPGEIGSQLYLIATLAEGADAQAVEAALDDELERLRTTGPSADELQRVRSQLYASTLRGLERVGGFGGVSDQLASAAVLAGDPAFWARELEWLQQATTASVARSLSTWTDAGHLTLTVLPEADHQTTENHVDRSALPVVTEAPALNFPDWQERTLDNGLRVVVATRPASPTTEYHWFARGGQAADPVGQEGLATLTMDLLDEGAGGRDSLALSRLLEQFGARLSTSASLDHFQVSLSVVRGLEATPLDVWADVLTRPDLPEDELERRRTLLLARIQQEQASPFSLGLRALPPRLYGADHPYGRPLTGSGTTDSVRAIQLADVRQHAARLLSPQDATLLIVGDIDLVGALASLPPAIRDWTPTAPPLPLPTLATQAPPKASRIYLLDRPGASQSVILAGQLTAPFADADNLAMETANALFGGLFTSRLNMNLREDKNWSYGAGSALVTTQAERPHVIYSRVQSGKTAPAMREIVYELRKLARPGDIRGEELRHATRNRALKLPGQHETTGQLTGSLAAILQRDLPADYFETLPLRLQKLAPADIQSAVQEHLSGQALQWVIVGDLATIRDDIEALGWGPVEILETRP